MNLGKNAKIANFGDGRWYFQFYDCDTTLGLDNSGNLRFGSDIEMEAGVFNTSNSRLWTRVRELFADDILNEWKLLRQDRFTLDNIMKYLFDDQIDKIPERYYNIDM